MLRWLVLASVFAGMMTQAILPLGETEPIEGPCPCILSCCVHHLQLRRFPGLIVDARQFSYDCCGCIECPPQVPRNPESEFPVVARLYGQLVELDVNK